jgi:hypothetical protein
MDDHGTKPSVKTFGEILYASNTFRFSQFHS